MIQRPVQNALEFTEDAISYLYDITAGNPYFTKLVCQFVFRSAINARDCFITRTEIEQVIGQAVRETGRNTFQHFWEDGIFVSSEKGTEKSIRRRKILITLSDILSKNIPATGKILTEHPLSRDIATLENDLKEFVSRKVLIGSINGRFQEALYDFKVRLFFEWLKDRGVQDIIATFIDLDNVLKEKQHEEQIKVQSIELVDLSNKWRAYRGQVISAENIRAWLDQFSGPQEQRAMFTILKHLNFYSDLVIRKKMDEIHNLIIRGLGRTIEYRQVKRSDILISYLDGPAKSGASLAKLYADEVGIYVDNIVEKGKILETISKKDDIKAIVFIDDFVGTGNQATENLIELVKDIGKVIETKNIKLTFVTICAFSTGWKKIKNYIQANQLNVELHYCNLLTESDQCFSDDSKVFPDQQERDFARSIAIKYGRIKIKDHPLGYGDLGLSVVFEHGCPNDSLPILWAESMSPKWNPLFKRH